MSSSSDKAPEAQGQDTNRPSPHRELHAQIVLNHPGLYTPETRRAAAETLGRPTASIMDAPAVPAALPGDLDALRIQAREAFAQEKWHEAAEAGAIVADFAPTDWEAQMILVQAIARRGSTWAAVAVASRLAALEPARIEWHGVKPEAEEPHCKSTSTASAGAGIGALQGKRVLVYTDDPGQGGAAQYSHTLLLALKAAGAKPVCAQPKAYSPLVIERAKRGVVQCWTGFNPIVNFDRSFVDVADAHRVLNEARPDLVFFSDCCALSHIAAKSVVASRGIPFITLCHAEAAYLADRFPQCLPIVKQQLTLASAVIAVCDSSLGVLRRRFGLAADKGQVIHSGCGDEFFAPVNTDLRARLRAELGIPSDGVLCLTAARIEAAKGHPLQFEAIRRLRDSGRLGSLHFAWAGEGDLRASLEQAAKGSKLDDRILFLGYRWDMANLMGAADILVLPTFHEALPLCVMEAMARGLPVVASAVGGISEELGETGILIPSPALDPEKTTNALADALAELGTATQRRQSLGQAGRERALAHFTRERMNRETLELVGAVACHATRTARHASTQ